MEVWKCPVCNEGLKELDKLFECGKGHKFDKAKQGYINLLQSQVSKTKQHGDEKEMVKARQEFLDAGYYSVFRDALSTVIDLTDNALIFDAGCGEGYYAKDFVEKHTVYGVDISKDAIIKASKRHKDMKCAVASTYAIPVMDGMFDLCYSVFAPFSIHEINRILKMGAFFVEVFPLENHLRTLKSILYTQPYLNEIDIKDYEGFELVEVKRVESNIELRSSLDIQNLFKMTPYYHRTAQEGVKALESLDSIKTEIGFGFAIYKKV